MLIFFVLCLKIAANLKSNEEIYNLPKAGQIAYGMSCESVICDICGLKIKSGDKHTICSPKLNGALSKAEKEIRDCALSEHFLPCFLCQKERVFLKLAFNFTSKCENCACSCFVLCYSKNGEIIFIKGVPVVRFVNCADCSNRSFSPIQSLFF